MTKKMQLSAMIGFGTLTCARDLRAKLEHDFRVLQEPATTYAAFNFFVTAERMLDWLYPGDRTSQETFIRRMCMRVALVLALCFFPALLTPLASLEAQLQPGQRVRITAPHLGINKHSGTLVAVDGDSLTVGTLQIALLNVTRLDVYTGREGHAGTGALVGGLVGGVSLAILFAAICDTSESDCREADIAAIGLLVGGATGLLAGSFVGALIKSDHWEEVPLDALRVSVAPQRNGRFELGLSVRF